MGLENVKWAGITHCYDSDSTAPEPNWITAPAPAPQQCNQMNQYQFFLLSSSFIHDLEQNFKKIMILQNGSCLAGSASQIECASTGMH